MQWIESKLKSTMIPFTVDQFLKVFERYNTAVWPAPLILYMLGLCAIYLAFQQRRDFCKSVAFILTMFWIWMGLVYHLWFFSSINRAALLFAVFFVSQGILYQIKTDVPSRHNSTKVKGRARKPTSTVANYRAAGVREYRASLIATSLGSPPSATLLRLGIYP